jgi:PII-like signaling protein
MCLLYSSERGGKFMNGKGKLLKIYIGESDRFHGEALYHAVLKKVHEFGLAGATTVKGIEGYGAGKRIHTTSIEVLAVDLPVTIEVIDYEDKINDLTEVLKDMITSGVMITMQNVEIVRYSKSPTEPK